MRALLPLDAAMLGVVKGGVEALYRCRSSMTCIPAICSVAGHGQRWRSEHRRRWRRHSRAVDRARGRRRCPTAGTPEFAPARNRPAARVSRALVTCQWHVTPANARTRMCGLASDSGTTAGLDIRHCRDHRHRRHGLWLFPVEKVARSPLQRANKSKNATGHQSRVMRVPHTRSCQVRRPGSNHAYQNPPPSSASDTSAST